MTKVQNRKADKSYEVYLALYQAVTGTEEQDQIYRQFSKDFFRVRPLSDLGTPLELVNALGGKDEYVAAVHALEAELYRDAV